MNRAEKEALVANLHENLRDSSLAVLVSYMGLNVEKMTELRRILKRGGVELKVVKNTLLRLAARGTIFEELEEHFVGPKALVFSQADPSVSTKLLMDFEKNNPELKAQVGSLEVQKLLRPQLEELASLPGREVLLVQTLQCMNAPIANFVSVLSGVVRQFAQVIEAIRQAKEQETAA